MDFGTIITLKMSSFSQKPENPLLAKKQKINTLFDLFKGN
jgi:hypothetical protein